MFIWNDCFLEAIVYICIYIYILNTKDISLKKKSLQRRIIYNVISVRITSDTMSSLQLCHKRV